MRRAVLALALCVADPASAQMTQCQWVGRIWSCLASPPQMQTANPNAMNAGAAAVSGTADAVNRSILMQQQIEAMRLQNEQAQNAANARNAVMARLRAGDCKGAIDLALASGDIALASQAKAFCSTP